MYDLPVDVTDKIINDYCDQDNGLFNSTEYENIMAQLITVDERILKRRLNVFNKFDYNKDGYIEVEDLPDLHTHMKNELENTNNTRHLYSVEFVLNHFNKNGCGQFNFLDINKYMQHLHLEFI